MVWITLKGNPIIHSTKTQAQNKKATKFSHQLQAATYPAKNHNPAMKNLHFHHFRFSYLTNALISLFLSHLIFSSLPISLTSHQQWFSLSNSPNSTAQAFHVHESTSTLTVTNV
jgi:hypothetical protein